MRRKRQFFLSEKKLLLNIHSKLENKSMVTRREVGRDMDEMGDGD